MEKRNDLIAAIATANGRGGIGIIRLSGDETLPTRIADLLKAQATATSPGEAMEAIMANPRVARRSDFLAADGSTIDSGIYLYFPAPHSFTGEHVIELHGHGGPVVMQMLLARCVELGARLARPGEFSLRAFLNGKIDLAQAEAIADLIAADTDLAARSAMRSLAGEFSQAIQQLCQALTEMRVLVEATLDFPEEDIDIIRDADVRTRLQQLAQKLQAVRQRAGQGRLLQHGMQVVLAGQPNVGKSSLLNRLAGEEVAIVTAQAGTTRDSLRSLIQIAGIPVHIIDTAGLRESQDEVEKMGIARTWKALESADLAIFLVDARDQESAADMELRTRICAKLPAGTPILTVANKMDLLAGEAATATPPDREKTAARLQISAKTGAGIELLRQQLLSLAGWQPTENVFIARQRHLEALSVASAHLGAAQQCVDAAIPQLELLAEELRLAQQSLGLISGEFSSDDLLGEIFSHFCIGK